MAKPLLGGNTTEIINYLVFYSADDGKYYQKQQLNMIFAAYFE